MKIRKGHVSNSSSSSFVLITTKRNYERAMEGLDPYAKAVAKALAEEQKLGDLDIVTFFKFSGMGGYGTFDFLDVDFDEEGLTEDEQALADEGKYEAWERFCEKLGDDEVARAGADW